jgi:hypothetical protein
LFRLHYFTSDYWKTQGRWIVLTLKRAHWLKIGVKWDKKSNLSKNLNNAEEIAKNLEFYFKLSMVSILNLISFNTRIHRLRLQLRGFSASWHENACHLSMMQLLAGFHRQVAETRLLCATPQFHTLTEAAGTVHSTCCHVTARISWQTKEKRLQAAIFHIPEYQPSL